MHTAVIGPGKLPLEVQIRTQEMHEHAELGVAAHWRYKEGGRAESALTSRRSTGCAQLLEPAQARTAPSRICSTSLQAEMFEDRVYALTPARRGGRPAEGRHAARLRLPRAHEPGPPVPRREGQWPHGAARTTRSRTATRSRSSPARQPQPESRLAGAAARATSHRARNRARCAPGSASRTKPRTASRAAQMLERELAASRRARALSMPEMLADLRPAECRCAARGPRRGRTDARRRSPARSTACACTSANRRAPRGCRRTGAAEVGRAGWSSTASATCCRTYRALLPAGAAGSRSGLHHARARRQHPSRNLRESRAPARYQPAASARGRLGPGRRRAHVPGRRS